VKDIYAQWKLQVDQSVTASRVRLQCSKASNDRHTRWCNSRGSRKTLGYGVQRYNDRRPGEI